MQNRQKAKLIPAIFEHREDADNAITLLHQMGLSDGDLDMSVVHPGELQSEGLLNVAAEKSVRRNARVGGFYGFFVGMVIAFAYMYIQHFFGLSGIWIGAVVGFLSGATLGAYRGLALSEMHWTARAAQQSRNALHEGEILLAVRPGARYDAVYQLLKTHGVRDFLDPTFIPNPTAFETMAQP